MVFVHAVAPTLSITWPTNQGIDPLMVSHEGTALFTFFTHIFPPGHLPQRLQKREKKKILCPLNSCAYIFQQKTCAVHKRMCLHNQWSRQACLLTIRQTGECCFFSEAASSSKHRVCGLSPELPNWNQRSLQDGRSRLPRWSDNSVAHYPTVSQRVFKCGTQVGYDTFGCTLMSGGPLCGDGVKQEAASRRSLDKQTVCVYARYVCERASDHLNGTCSPQDPVLYLLYKRLYALVAFLLAHN